ncbi:MAG: phage packaging Nu1 protein [Rhizobium sp.]|nr:phage packaging Nu1 protein [Rhizobium sp.]
MPGSKDYSEIRGKLMSIPDALAGNVDVSIANKVRKIADDHIRSVLDGLKTRDTLLV